MISNPAIQVSIDRTADKRNPHSFLKAVGMFCHVGCLFLYLCEVHPPAVNLREEKQSLSKGRNWVKRVAWIKRHACPKQLGRDLNNPLLFRRKARFLP